MYPPKSQLLEGWNVLTCVKALCQFWNTEEEQDESKTLWQEVPPRHGIRLCVLHLLCSFL